MPRIHGIRYWRDKSFYATSLIEPGESIYLFGKEGMYDFAKTNMQMPGCFSSDQTFITVSIGVRLLGTTQEEEDRLLDYIQVTYNVGDHPMKTVFGSYASVLRSCRQDDSDSRESIIDEPPGEYSDLHPAFAASARAHEDFKKRCLLNPPPGYVLMSPIVVPVRQSISVLVCAAKELPKTVALRVFLFGILKRDVS